MRCSESPDSTNLIRVSAEGHRIAGELAERLNKEQIRAEKHHERIDVLLDLTVSRVKR